MNESQILAATRTLCLVVAAMLSSNLMAETRTAPAVGKATTQLTQSYVWYNGNREERVWLNPQLVAEFNPSAQGATAARSADTSARTLSAKYSQGAVRMWRMDNTGDAAIRSMSTRNPAGRYSPVFHNGSTSGAPMRALPGNIIVYLNPTWDATAVDTWVKSHRLEVVKKLEIGPNIYIIKTGPGLEALNTANALYLSGEVAAAFPDWWREVSTR